MVVVSDDELRFIEGEHVLITYKPRNWIEQRLLDRSVSHWRFAARHMQPPLPLVMTLEARELPAR